MSDTIKDFSEFGSNYFRTMAGRQLPAIKEYGTALQAFSAGKIDEIEFGKSLMNLGFREYLRNAEDTVKFGFEFYSKLLSSTGIKFEEAMDKFSEAASSGSGKAGKR